MDRRRFLTGLAWAGLASGLASVGAACGPSPLPRATSRTGPLATEPYPSATPPLEPVPPSSGPPPSDMPAVRDSRIAEENRRPGTRDWDRPVDVPAGASGFLSQASAAPGDRPSLHLASPTPVDVLWYRLGWYGGDGGRLLRVDRDLPGGRVAPPLMDARTGRAEAAWPPAIGFEIPGDWMSGMYVACLQPATGAAGYVPFIVRPDPRTGTPAPVLFVSASTTWQAYNLWGGANLYDAYTADSPLTSSGRRAFQVSFDRPYAADGGTGFQRRWELPFVRWQEREGRDVDYVADVDLELHPELVAGRRLVVFAGHHEYWSRPMRTTLAAAVSAGVNVAFLSANEIYWQVRLEASGLGPARRVTCYKSAKLDPLAHSQPALTTCRWREAPVSEPEATLIGQMYGHIVRRPADWVVRSADHWLYEGTGLRDGDRLTNLVGQEYDTYFAQFAPSGTVVLAQGPVDAVMQTAPGEGDVPSPAIHTATMYTATSGATVFAAGTFQWSWAVDVFGPRAYRGFATPYDERVVRMTRNLFDRLGDGPASGGGPASRRYVRPT